MSKNWVSSFLERSALQIVVGLVVKVAIIVSFFFLVKVLLPFELFGPTAIILVCLAIFIWFFEIEGSVISEIVSVILLRKMNPNTDAPVESKKDSN